MPELLVTLPFDVDAGRPVFPASLVEANGSNPISDGTPGNSWKTECYTPTTGYCIVRVVTNSASIAATLEANTADLSALLVDTTLNTSELDDLKAALADVYADDVVALVTDDSSDTADIRDALDTVKLYKVWTPGEQGLQVGDVRLWQRNLYRVFQPVGVNIWEPQNAPALWVRYYPAGSVPDWVQPTGAHDAWPQGAEVLFNGLIYVSLINANVWSPDVTGWELKPGQVEPTSEWVSGEQIVYDPNNPAQRTYEGVVYELRQSPGINIWPPPTVPALWQAI